MSGIPGAGPPPLPYQPGDRSRFLAWLLAELARATTADGRPFGLGTRALDDPTVALLDGWATVADVIAFYQERIAAEGFLRTATQPGSLLAIAQLMGYRPRPGLAASVWLAYRLHPDTADTAVVLPAGLLAQSVPGAGELPQTFETSGELVARPSWNILPVRKTSPVTAPHGLAALTKLAFHGVNTGLAAGDVVLLYDTSSEPTPVQVHAVRSDLASQVTSITLQPPAAAQPAEPGAPAGPGSPVSRAIDELTPGLTTLPAAPPPSGAALNRGPAEAFAANSDAVSRLVAALHPALAGALYKALDTTTMGTPAVTGASLLKVHAAPFGVRMPPRPVFNLKGQQVGTEEWPIGDVQVLSAQLGWQDGTVKGETVQISMQGPLGPTAVSPRIGQRVDSAGIGTIAVSATMRSGTLIEFTAAAPELQDMSLALHPSGADSVTITFDGNELTWPLGSVAGRFTIGADTVTLEWQSMVLGQEVSRGGGILTVWIARALPLSEPQVLDLDAVYPGIVPSSWVVIDSTNTGSADPSYPLVAHVTQVATTAVARYGMSGTVTQLTLSKPWIGASELWLSAARPLTVHAQPAGLTLLPVPVSGPLSGADIDLDGLFAGIEAGRRIVVTGNRSDLPAGATVPAGEAAMVKGVTQQPRTPGDTPHTTLHLAAALTYSYDLASVQIYGNVVPARQGATVTEPLAGAVPGDPHPAFTLSQAPVLADPSATAAGSVSSLQLSVGGRRWAPVTRLDAATPPHSYLTGTDSQGRTTIELSGPLPTGTSSVVATYRAGLGSAGNVRAHQVTQLLSRPLAVAGVDNPLPGSGGSDGDGPGDLRAGAPAGLASLGRLVSATDAADLVRAWAGVGKAHSASVTDGGGEVIAVTVAGVDPVPLDPAGELCTDLAGALDAAGDPGAPVLVLPARLYLIVLAGRVRCAASFGWAGVSAALRDALFSAFGYPQRRLGQDVIVSEITAVALSVPGVESFTVTALTLLPTTASAVKIQTATAALPPPPPSGRLPLPVPRPAVPLTAAAVAFLSDTVNDTLLLQQVTRR